MAHSARIDVGREVRRVGADPVEARRFAGIPAIRDDERFAETFGAPTDDARQRADQEVAERPGRIRHERIAKVAKNFLGVNVLDAGHMLADEAVRRAVVQRVPFLLSAPRCGASFCVTQLAMRFEQGIASAEDSGGFFNRMSKWFKKG